MDPKFDVTTKSLMNEFPEELVLFWGRMFHFHPESIRKTNVEVTKAIRADNCYICEQNGYRYILHLEWQGSYDAGLDRRSWFYNSGIDHADDLVVCTIIVLMRREAEVSHLQGEYVRGVPWKKPTHQFNYDVVRLWTLPFDWFIDGPASLLPFALLTDEAAEDLPRACQRVLDSANSKEPDPVQRRELFSKLFFLSGMRYNSEYVESLMRNIDMKESSTYMATIEKGEKIGIDKGRITEGIEVLLQLGSQRFGKPTPQVLNELNAITSHDRLTVLYGRILTANSWDEFLAK